MSQIIPEKQNKKDEPYDSPIDKLVEMRRVELLTSALRTQRSAN